jgi:phosphoglycolate phosphatase
MSFNAIILDLDGTLLNTLEDLADSVNRTMAGHDLPLHPLDKFRYFVGDGARNLIKRALPEDRRDDKTVDEILREFRAEYAVNWNVKSRPYPGVAEMLDALQEMRIKLAVLSNKPDEDTRKCVSAFLPKWRFDHVLGAREGVPLKPDPAAALEITRVLEVPPPSFLFLGDTRMDVETALAAGMFPVGALWGFREREELEQAGAKSLAAQPMDVLRLLE